MKILVSKINNKCFITIDKTVTYEAKSCYFKSLNSAKNNFTEECYELDFVKDKNSYDKVIKCREEVSKIFGE